MKNIYFLISKNLKLLVRAKSSALIVILAPLMIILLIGLSYNTSQTGLNIGVHSPSFTKEINSFLVSLQGEGYKVVKYTDAKECVEDIKLGFVHTCLSLPKDFSVSDNKQKEIVFYIDQSKINLVYIITDTLNKKLNIKSTEISKGLVSGILTKFTTTQKKIKEKSSTVDRTKASNQKAATQSSAIKSTLVSLDFKVSNKTYNTAIVSSFQSNASEKITTSLGALDDAKSAISSSNLNSSEKSAVNADIAKAESELNQLKGLFNSSGSGSMKEITSLVSSLQADLGGVKKKLTTASTKVSAAGGQLTSMATTLQQSVTSLGSVKKSLTEIQTDLASQKVTSAGTVASPIKTKIKKISVEKTFLSYMFPSLMVLVVMFISILLGTTLVMMEKHSPAYFRNFVTPVKKITFVFATYLTNSLLIIIQIGIILGISLLFLDNKVGQLPLTALVLFVSSSVFTLLGMAIGYFFTSEDTGTLASISAGSLLLFVSGVVLPLESMPATVRMVTSFNPFVISEKLIRELFIFNSSFSVILSDLLVLVGYAVALFVFILIVDSLMSKHFITKIAYKHHKMVRLKRAKIKSAAGSSSS